MENKPQAPSPLFDTLDHVKQVNNNVDNLPVLSAGNALLDLQHATNFLYHYRGSQATFNAYRREIERLLQWAWLIKKQGVSTLNRADIELFIEFCQSPPKSWIATQNMRRFFEKNAARVPNANWRPFVATVSKRDFKNGKKPSVDNYLLSNKAVQSIFSILSSFYNYLIQEEYISANPVAQMRQKSKFIRKQQQSATVRRLSELQWAFVIETTELMAKTNPSLHERTLFIMNALYAMYLRISELAANNGWEPQMSHFFKDMDGNWWFKTVGKGNKERDITVSDAMLEALKRYRLSLGLSSLPAPGDNHPLIPKLSGKGAISDTRQIRNIVQDCFDKSFERLKKEGFGEEADALVSATVHWLRHTGISDDVKIRPREHVRDDAGHSSSMITDRYIDIELRERHASAKKKLIKKD